MSARNSFSESALGRGPAAERYPRDNAGRLANYQGNPSIRDHGRPSVGNYLGCVLAFHDCRFAARAKRVLGPWGGAPLLPAEKHAPLGAAGTNEAVAAAERCAWPPAAVGRDGHLALPSRLMDAMGGCVTVDVEGGDPDAFFVTMAPCIAETKAGELYEAPVHRPSRCSQLCRGLLSRRRRLNSTPQK